MTPLQIEILLHYYTSPRDYADGNFRAPSVREAIDWFVENELLRGSENGLNCYRLTDRGNVYIDALLDIPLPVKRWVME